jgi:MFS superfamily sulfate permease-like transporter
MIKYFKHTPQDLLSGLVVFLVALPLCLGIALASGAPLFSGIISGVVAGLVVGSLSNSHLSVSGPAAGLTVIVLDAISDLGSFEAFLVAVVIGGVIQLMMGFFRAGIIGLFFPVSVIKGMLAAIGLILIMKQIPYFLGLDPTAFKDLSFLQVGGRKTSDYFNIAFDNLNTGALIAGVGALIIMVLWDYKIKQYLPKISFIPGALIGVLFGMGINYWLRYAGSDIMITDGYLVNLPNIKDPEVFKESFVLPDWSIILDPIVWKVAIVIAVIASLETLLSVEAVDNLDPHKRKTDKDQELKAQGVGNIIAGMIGGIPMTAVIVRSTANLESGARSKMSAIYHGIFLAGCVVLIPFVLNDIPLAALAAILLMVGYKLSKPSLYINMWKAGKSQFIPFIITIAAILIEDLLVGILIGLGVGIIFILKANYDNSHFYDEIQEPEGGYKKKITIRLSEHVSFLNKSGLINRFEKVQPNTHVVIDAKDSLFIDYDVMGIINDFIINGKEKDIHVEVVNYDEERVQS